MFLLLCLLLFLLMSHCCSLCPTAQVLLANLQDNNVHRTVKPQILSVFGDVALAIGPEFRKYLEHVLQTLMQVNMVCLSSTGIDKSIVKIYAFFVC